MDEKPKSIWEKSWTGRRALLIWGALAVVTVLLLIFIAALGKLDAPIGSTFQTVGIIGIGIVILGLIVIYFLFPICRWLFWKHWRRTLFGLACFATLIALFYAEEDWRGKHDWEKFKRESEAKGEHFDFASVVPPPVPDDQNFALTPVVASCYETYFDKNGHEVRPRNTNVVDRLSMITWRDNHWAHEPKSENWQTAKKTDLKAWQEYFRSSPPANSKETNSFPIAPQPQTPAADILLALSKYDSAIAEIRAASQLPYSRFPLTYDQAAPFDILLPHLTAVKPCAQVVSLRALAELQNGESEKSAEDVKLALYLSGSIRTEPFLISHLVRIAILQITLQPIYEGLAEHKWSDAELVELDSELAKLNFLADFEMSIRGERAASIADLDYMRRGRKMEFGDDAGQRIIQKINWLVPSAFFYQNELTIARIHQEYNLPLVDAQNQTASPTQVRKLQTAAEQDLNHDYWPYKIFAKMLMPPFTGFAKKFSYAQGATDLARTAIALERFRLAHGNFPGSLDALAPQFIAQVPHDVIGGQPLKYRREANGQFILYSVGWNETDDGGVVGYRKGGTVPDFESGDWVWRYPQK